MVTSLTRCLFAVPFLLLAISLATAAPQWKETYNPLVVRTLYLQLDSNDWDRVRFDQPVESETWVPEVAPAMFHEEGEAPIEVTVRRKGATDPELPDSGNPQKVSLKIDFNELVPGQTWGGVRKLSLEIGGAEGPLHEGFAWQIHRLAADGGLYHYDAANAAWVKLYINGTYRGVFTSTEQRDEQFLRNRDLFSEGNTWLYKVDGSTMLELGAVHSPTYNHLNFAPFKGQGGGGGAGGTVPNLDIDLPQWIDMESMMALAACEAYVENNDGLVTHSGKNSFAADFNPPNQRLRMYFPWDMDSGIKDGNGQIYGNEPYQTTLLDHAWFGRVYEHTFRELLAGKLSTASLHAFIDQLAPVLGPALESDPYAPSSAAEFASLKSWVVRRNANVTAKFLKPHVPRPVPSHAGGEVVSGYALSMSAPSGQIYYTLNGSDPRAPGGAASASAVLYTTPVLIDRTTRITARTLLSGNWSGLPARATFNIAAYATPLRVTEIMYHPADANPTDTIDRDEYEFIELLNTGTTPLNLSDYYFDGISWSFPGGTIVTPGGYIVLVKNASAFASRYPGVGHDGIYLGGLNNGGEKIRLRNTEGTTVISVEYNDDPPWVLSPDGAGWSLVNQNPDGNPDAPANWRASRNLHGSPGGPDPLPDFPTSVVINEVLANTAAPYEDAVELRNTGTAGAGIGGWFLSDASRNAAGEIDPAVLKKFRLPPGTSVAPNGYTAVYEQDLSASNALVPFSLNAAGGRVFLSSADAAGNLTGFITALDFPATELNTAWGQVSSAAGTDTTRLAVPTFGATSPGDVAEFRAGAGAVNSAPLTGPVVMSEIMYNPLPAGSEFVEIHNISAGPVDISAWDIEGVATFEFPPGTILPAGGYAVIVDAATTTVEAFRTAYSVPVAAQVFSPPFDLGNAGETLTLEKPNPVSLAPDIPIDRVRYNDKPPWPTEADGAGPSLERDPVAAYGNEPLNWRARTMQGTPGGPATGSGGIAIARGSFWDYKAASAALDGTWKDLSYNATAWQNTATPAGYGESFITGVVSFGADAQQKYPSTYFRKPFAITDTPASITGLALSVLYDDGVVVWLNGQEVARRGMPQGTITYGALASSDTEAVAYEEIDMSAFRTLLVQGQNILSVEVHQSAPDSSDLVWDAGLSYTTTNSTDIDNDGLPDAWETAHGLDPDNPDDAGDDFDGDGWNNLAEFRAGTIPTNAFSFFRIIPDGFSATGNQLIRWDSIPGHTYQVSYSPDLTTWFSFGPASHITATGSVTTFTDLGDAAPRRFFKVEP